MKQYDHKKIEKSRPSSARASAGKQKEYDHRKLERKWQVVWDKQKLYKTSDTNKGEKMYVCILSKRMLGLYNKWLESIK